MKKILGILALAVSVNAFAENATHAISAQSGGLLVTHATLVILDAEQRTQAYEIADRLAKKLSISVIDCTKLANDEVCVDLHKNNEKAGIILF